MLDIAAALTNGCSLRSMLMNFSFKRSASPWKHSRMCHLHLFKIGETRAGLHLGDGNLLWWYSSKVLKEVLYTITANSIAVLINSAAYKVDLLVCRLSLQKLIGELVPSAWGWHDHYAPSPVYPIHSSQQWIGSVSAGWTLRHYNSISLLHQQTLRVI